MIDKAGYLISTFKQFDLFSTFCWLVECRLNCHRLWLEYCKDCRGLGILKVNGMGKIFYDILHGYKYLLNFCMTLFLFPQRPHDGQKCPEIWHVPYILWLLIKHIFYGKDYSGAKFSYTEPISLNKAHSTKWKAFDNKTLHLYNHSHILYVQVCHMAYEEFTLFGLPNSHIQIIFLYVYREWLYRCKVLLSNAFHVVSELCSRI